MRALMSSWSTSQKWHVRRIVRGLMGNGTGVRLDRRGWAAASVDTRSTGEATSRPCMLWRRIRAWRESCAIHGQEGTTNRARMHPPLRLRPQLGGRDHSACVGRHPPDSLTIRMIGPMSPGHHPSARVCRLICAGALSSAPPPERRSREGGIAITARRMMPVTCPVDAGCLLGFAYELGRNAMASEASRRRCLLTIGREAGRQRRGM